MTRKKVAGKKGKGPDARNLINYQSSVSEEDKITAPTDIIQTSVAVEQVLSSECQLSFDSGSSSSCDSTYKPEGERSQDEGDAAIRKATNNKAKVRDGIDIPVALNEAHRPAKKKRCLVVPKRHKKNVACRVEHYLSVVRSFSPHKIELVKQMGFECLLDFDVSGLNRDFCMWLYHKFDPETCCLVLNDHEVIQIRPNHVSWVLGLPMNGRVVPKTSSQVCQSGKDRIASMKQKYGFDKGIPKKPVHDELLKCDVSDEDFQVAFLLFILGNLLCPTQSTSISPELLPAATVSMSSNDYAWGQFVFDWLRYCGKRFRQDMKKVAGPQGAGGCALVLMIVYLDRKPLPLSVNWYRIPRLLAWSDEAVQASISSDMFNSGAFGKTKLLHDVHYGHPHPSESPDMPWGCPLGSGWTQVSLLKRCDPNIGKTNGPTSRKQKAHASGVTQRVDCETLSSEVEAPIALLLLNSIGKGCQDPSSEHLHPGDPITEHDAGLEDIEDQKLD